MKKILVSFILLSSLCNLNCMERSSSFKRPNDESPSQEKRRKYNRGSHSSSQPMSQEVMEKSLYPMAVFNEKIEDVVAGILLKERGKIWGAYYNLTSQKFVDAWSLRKYSQEFTSAYRNNDISAMMVAEKYKKESDDIIIVDSSKNNKPACLSKLVLAGIKVLQYTKQREPYNDLSSMHDKFMIVFDQKGEGKLLIQGSWNMTKQANFNREHITILNDRNLIEAFVNEFKDIESYCTPYIIQDQRVSNNPLTNQHQRREPDVARSSSLPPALPQPIVASINSSRPAPVSNAKVVSVPRPTKEIVFRN